MCVLETIAALLESSGTQLINNVIWKQESHQKIPVVFQNLRGYGSHLIMQ